MSASTPGWVPRRSSGLGCVGTNCFFKVEDNGTGFDYESVRLSGHGFTNMTERMVALGGTLSVESSPGLGAVVRGMVPIGRSAT